MATESPIGFSWLIRLVTPYRSVLALALVLMLGESLVALATPWIAGQFTRGLLEDAAPLGFSLRTLLALWLGILLVQAVLRFANQYVLVDAAEQMGARLRMRLYEHLQALPLSHFQERKHGEVLSVVINDAGILSSFVTGPLLRIVPQVLVLAGALVMIATIDPVMALIVTLVLPAFYIVMKLIGRRVRPLARERIDAFSGMLSLIEENLSVLPVIKAFTRENIESRRFEASNERLRETSRRYMAVQSALSPAIRFLAAAGIIAILWLSLGGIESGALDTPALVSLLLYGMLLTGPISGFADLYGQVQMNRAAAERVLEVFAAEPEPAGEGLPDIGQVSGAVSFRDVDFGYRGRGRLFDGLCLDIAAGETIAITGENGCGKSTLVHLLMRYMDPDSGRVLVDGRDVREVSLSSLRRQVGLVSQNVLLLNASVRDNIAFARADADDDAITRAAAAAHALAFIEALPQGFDTIIGDQGVKLSGGQKQRLALARAFLKDAPILVLDEATAMFDPEGERGFIADSAGLVASRTLIIITHRPASLALADRIVRVEKGRVVEMTTTPKAAQRH